MSLNIKSREAHQLAQSLARLTGESLTTAVTIALKQRLERLERDQHPALAERMLRIGRDCAAHLVEPYRSAEHGDVLYDDRGLPR